MDIKTTIITASIPTDTERRVYAFNEARNGSFHNSVAELLEAGLKAKLSEAPEPFIASFKKAWLGEIT